MVGSREEAGEMFDWKHESGCYEMYGIIIVYIVSSLPNNHVKPLAQCWQWRGHEQQDSNSVTVARCPQSEVPAREGSRTPQDVTVPAANSLQCTLKHDPTCNCHK